MGTSGRTADGKTDKISLPFVNTFFTTFPETIKSVKQKNKVECVGPVLSDRLFNGNKEEGAKFSNLEINKPTIMVIGGSLGAKSLNEAVKNNLKEILKTLKEVSSALDMLAIDLYESAKSTSEHCEQISQAVDNVANGAASQAEDTQNITDKIAIIGEDIEKIKSNTDTLLQTAEDMEKIKNK